VRKHCCDTDTPSGPSKKFQKQAYQLLEESDHILIHYIGDEKKAIEFAHGCAAKHPESHTYTHAHLQFEILNQSASQKKPMMFTKRRSAPCNMTQPSSSTNSKKHETTSQPSIQTPSTITNF